MKKSNRRDFIKHSVIGASLVGINQTVLAAQATPDEIKGPFYPVTPQKDQDFDLTQIEGNANVAQGEVVIIHGHVLDTAGQPVENATVDIWQANAVGRYNHPHDENPAPLDPNFQGWAIVQSGQQGGFKFKTIIPGAYPVSAEWTRPPHIHFKVSKSGYQEVVTQMYFPDHQLNQLDKLLLRKSTDEQKMMTAQPDPSESAGLVYNIVLQPV